MQEKKGSEARRQRTPKQEEIDARISAGLLLWYHQTPSLDRKKLSVQEIASLADALRAAFGARKGDIM
jgi:nitrate reductase alpha subunit